MIVHLIYDPNSPTAKAGGAEVRVHKAGCRDITVNVLKAATSHYKLHVGSQRQASDHFWSDLIAEESVSSDDALESYTEFLPCTEGLPREEGETMTETTPTTQAKAPRTRRTAKPATAKPETTPAEAGREHEREEAAKLLAGVTRNPEPPANGRTRNGTVKTTVKPVPAKPATETAPKPATRTRKPKATAPAPEPAPATTRTRKPAPAPKPAPKPAPAAANGTKTYGKQVLARKIVDLLATSFKDASPEDKARISYWLHGLPTGGSDGSPAGGGNRYWPASLPRPTTADWR